MRFFFTADIHGSEIVSNKLTNAAQFYNVKNIVVGGDLAGKNLVPILKEGNKYRLNLFGEQKIVKENELPDIEKEIRNAGEYYKIMDKDEYEKAKGDEARIEDLFKEEAMSNLEAFLAKAEEKLKRLGGKLYIMPGNDDYDEFNELLEKHAGNVIVPIDQKIVDIEGFNLLGYGYSNPTPWNTPREKSEKEIYNDLKKLVEKEDHEKSIFAIHVPPYNTKIDKAPKLDKELRQVISAGNIEYVSIGSTSVRRIIEEYAPIVGVHGHVHEAMGIDYIRAKNGKDVPVINPGSVYSSGMLNGVIIEINEKSRKLERYIFTKG
ncbi:MAG: metallophosphoesterase family protein [Candidatus Micrarchaeia archaeon]